MSRFAVSRTSTADIDAGMDEVFDILEQPARVAELTPFLHSIIDRGDGTWLWSMTGIATPTGRLSPAFTERMTLQRPSLIRFEHAPPPGSNEIAGADGEYHLTPRADGQRGCTLHIALTVMLFLPLPALSRPLFRTTMNKVIDQMGAGFSRNILAELAGGGP
ncbi:SRPBCC family protein [Ammonicoccus fulvus]|uniref:SRPBCC family protein n=1 Tax=Ammonicoccus fulvus TaxID=3138240 RepID=A0ABZ3FN11_9ACTN